MTFTQNYLGYLCYNTACDRVGQSDKNRCDVTRSDVIWHFKEDGLVWQAPIVPVASPISPSANEILLKNASLLQTPKHIACSIKYVCSHTHRPACKWLLVWGSSTNSTRVLSAALILSMSSAQTLHWIRSAMDYLLFQLDPFAKFRQEPSVRGL